jgi:methionine-S-sulfoxide reductase
MKKINKIILSLLILTFSFGTYAADKMTEKAKITETATVAGGCFWGMQEIIRHLPGVLSTQVGYTGGVVANATYDLVHTGSSGHAEAVQVIFDPQVISYKKFLTYFFRMHDPTTLNQQGNDKGSQYRSVIFYHSPEQKRIAEESIEIINKSKKWKNPIVTQLSPAGKFYKAEENHQDYLQKNPAGYTCHFLRPE